MQPGSNEHLFAAIRAWAAVNYPGAPPEEFALWLRGRPRPARLPVPEAVQQPAREEAFVPTELQADILEALEGKALRSEPLAQAVGVSKRTLYREPGGLPELQRREAVRTHSRLGYYRPDAPPQELQSEGTGA